MVWSWAFKRLFCPLGKKMNLFLKRNMQGRAICGAALFFLSPRWGFVRYGILFSAGVSLHFTACLKSFVPTELGVGAREPR